MTLPTDQKVGGSSPFERATLTGLVGIPARPVVVWGPGVSERSSCVLEPLKAPFGLFLSLGRVAFPVAVACPKDRQVLELAAQRGCRLGPSPVGPYFGYKSEPK